MTENIDGGVIELGSGDGSTKLLKNKLGNLFVSFDNNKEWCDKTGSLLVDYNKFDITGSRENLKCIFIDTAPAETRKELIRKWVDVPILIIHDTEIGAEYVYGMNDVLSTFKYRLDYDPNGKPNTTAVSNFIDVTKWI